MKLRRRSSIVVLIVGLFLQSIAIPALAGLTDIPITGTVKDRAGTGLGGVLINEGGRRAWTDSSGNFTINLPAGQSFTLYASKQGLEPESRSGTAWPGTTVSFEMYYSISLSVSPTIFYNGPRKTISLVVRSYTPSDSCVNWTDTTSGTTIGLELSNAVSSGESTWTGNFIVPGETRDATHSTAASAGVCDVEIALTRVAFASYMTDSLAASVDLATLNPPDGGNTGFLSQVLSAKVSDERSGIDPASISFELVDVTDPQNPIVTNHPGTLVGSWAKSPPVTLDAGHSYRFAVAAADKAGNEVVASQWRGFSAFPPVAHAGNAAIPITSCVVSESIDIQTQTKTVTCPDVPLSFGSTTVSIPGTTWGPGTAFVEHTASLAGARLRTSIAGTEQSQSAYPSSAIHVTALPFQFPATTSQEQTLTVTAKTVTLGTLTTTVPATWTNATLDMPITTTNGAFSACNEVGSTSFGILCTSDPLDYGFTVKLKSSVGNTEQVAAQHAERHGLIVRSVDEGAKTYSAWIPFSRLGPLAGEGDVQIVTRDRIGIGVTHVPHHILPASNEIGFDVVYNSICPGCDQASIAAHFTSPSGIASLVTTTAAAPQTRLGVFALPGEASSPLFDYWLEVTLSCSQGCPSINTRLPAAGTYQASFKDMELETISSSLSINLEQARKAIDITPDVGELRLAAEAAHPDTFAGVWRDYTSNGGRVQVAFTDDPQGKLATLASDFPDPAFLDPVLAAYSQQELQALADQITADLAMWSSNGVRITTVAADAIRNRVAVGILEGDESARTAINGYYDPAKLFIEEGPEIRPNQDEDPGCERYSCVARYLRAGLWIDIPAGNTIYSCSTAFTASLGASYGYRGILTAGHCAPTENAFDRRVLHSGVLLGASAYHQFSGNVDGMWIDVVDAWQPSANWVWEEIWSKKYTITSRIGSGGGAVGDPICHSGARRGYRCGQIKSTNVTVNIRNGPTLTDQKADDICTGPGDSGGPVYSNHVAHGIMSASNMTVNENGIDYKCADVPRTYYTGIYNTERALGVVTQTWPRSCFSGFNTECLPGT